MLRRKAVKISFNLFFFCLISTKILAPKTPVGVPGLSLSSKIPIVAAAAVASASVVESPSPESPWITSTRRGGGRFFFVSLIHSVVLDILFPFF